MNEIGFMIKEGRKISGLSQGGLSKELEKDGITLSAKTISGYENGISEPNASLFLSICKILEIPDPVNEYAALSGGNKAMLNSEGLKKVTEYMSLLMNDKKYCAFLPEDKISIEKSTSTNSDDISVGSNDVKHENNIISIKEAKHSDKVSSHKNKNKVLGQKSKIIPIFDLAVSAGTGDFLDSTGYEEKEIDNSVPTGASFGVRVSGDSMEPYIKNGDILYVKKQDTLENGEIGIFSIDGNAYVKKFQNDNNGLFLISLNKKYSPIPVGEYSELKIFGKVLQK